MPGAVVLPSFRLEVEDAESFRAPRLALRFAGESLPFGDALSAHKRIKVARELRRALAAR